MEYLTKAQVFLTLAAVTAMSFPASALKQPKDLIAKERATEIATKAAPGIVKSSEVEFERKQWVYSFDIQGSDKQIHEVLVNAKTGKIVENKIESAAAEADEAKQDAKDSVKK
jgi:hypothetical protein